MFALPLLVFAASQAPVTIEGDTVRLVLSKRNGFVVEEFFARDAGGKMRQILTSPGATVKAAEDPSGALQGASRGLYAAIPDLRLTSWERIGDGTVRLRGKLGSAEIVKVVSVPRTGRDVRVELDAEFGMKRTTLHAFLLSYAFLPDGKPEKPDSTFLPGLRPKDDNVVGDHFFRAPVACAQRGSLAALLIPDVEVLAENRPMETILDLDARSGVSDATLMSYGFCAHRLTGHVAYSTDSSLLRSVPGKLHLAATLLLDAQAEPFAAYSEAVAYHWKQVGHGYFDKIKPQMMPFADYARVCYPAAFAEQYGANKLGWFEVTIDGKLCGGIPSGWGFDNGWVSWQGWFNQLRSAWGLHWWGKKLRNQDWIDKSNKMLNLALAAPMDRGACPTTYLSREKAWKGTLIAPDPRCYYDLTNMAWKGIWMLRWLQFEDCPEREEVLAQCMAMAQLMVNKQNADGSFPTWLDKNLAVVPILDHSAQSALPAWFLGELAKTPGIEHLAMDGAPWISGETQAGPVREICEQRLRRAADFLMREVVDQQRYYDFETFFSCSPKQCLQRDGKIDDLAMHDAHSMSPPQNTLCMQWAAEALMAADKLSLSTTGSHRPYFKAAMKALNIMALYQNVWPISYRKVAYTFGGFGVQNSDGEYNDARQAQFGCTLADFGADLGRQDLFERGVAATRASLTLINHPLHADNGIYPNPNYPLGLQPENNGHGGTDQQNGRTGFDWGEGSGLASMAWLMHKYGGTYRHPSGWAVLVDGGSKALDLQPGKETLRDPVWLFDDWRLKGWTVEGDFAEVPTWSTRLNFGVKPDEGFIGTCEDGSGGFDDRFTGTVTSEPFISTGPTIKLLVGGGSGKGVYVELLAPDGKQVYSERGHDREQMDERTWDVKAYQGQPLRIRIVDRETAGWGHINVARIRVGARA